MDKHHGINSAGGASDPPDESAVVSDSDVTSVGYKQPPIKTQFKKGRSGNPKGRPKGSENLSSLLQAVLAERISVSQGGKTLRMSKAEALVQLTLNQAIKGDTKAIDGILALADKIGRFKVPSEDGQIKPGVVIVPERCETYEEWERLYGAAARGDKYFMSNGKARPPKVTRPFTTAAGDQLFKQGKFDEALGCYRRNLAHCQAMVAKDTGNAEAQTGLQLAIDRICFIARQFIIAGQFAKAIDTFDQAIELAPTVMHWPRLRAYALMMYGNVHQAKAIYLEHRGEGSWEADALKDFENGRKIGHAHPLMDEIEKLFAAAEDVHER